ncbi:MAG: CAAX amino terminal protease family, partial [Candidatus Nanosalina sp. J07AB43]
MSLKRLTEVLRNLSWLKRVHIFAFALLSIEIAWNPSDLPTRAFEKFLVFFIFPLLFVKAHGRQLGLSFNRDVVINTISLCIVVLPFYALAGSIPIMRSFYPIGDVPLEFMPFAIHQFYQFFLALGNEVYYRGILCVWIRDIGVKSIFVSPVIYAYRHIGKPSPEFIGSAPADIVFGWFDYKSKSIIPSVVAHWVGMML